MWKQKYLCLGFLALLLSANAYSQDEDRQAVLTLMQLAFDAVGSGNPDDMRALQLPEGTSLSVRGLEQGAPGGVEIRISTNEVLVAAETDTTQQFMERWIGEPTVLIRGPIAVVWGEYEFYIDGVFSHCGVDSADLVKMDGVWKIANWMWTVEKDNCPNRP